MFSNRRKICRIGELIVKRQTEPQGVVTRWVASPLDVDPFSMPARFSLKRAALCGFISPVEDQIFLTRRSVLVRTYFLNRLISRKTLKIREFSGVAIRISLVGEREHDLKVSVNLHHQETKYCIPLHYAFDLDVSSARLQSWAKNLSLPILLPDAQGTWFEPVERLGRLVIRPPYDRANRANLMERKSVFSRCRETYQNEKTATLGVS